MDIRVMFKSGVEILINDVNDDEIRIVKIQMKNSKVKTVWIKTKSETLSINKKSITLVSYISNIKDTAKVSNVNSRLYQ